MCVYALVIVVVESRGLEVSYLTLWTLDCLINRVCLVLKQTLLSCHPGRHPGSGTRSASVSRSEPAAALSS